MSSRPVSSLLSSAVRPSARRTAHRALHVSASRSKTGESSGMSRITDLMRKLQDPTSPSPFPPESADADESQSTQSRSPASDSLSRSSPATTTTPTNSELSSHPRSGSPFNLPFAGPLDTPAMEEATGSHPFLAREHERERVYERSREDALRWFRKEGYDTQGTFEQRVVWGDMDTFQHVNNVRFIRWIESARLEWGASFAGVLPDKTLVDWVSGKGMGIILKDVSMRYRFPVTYPDTVLITNKIQSINQERASFGLANALWSLRENKLVATGDSTIVVYDYDRLKKGVMTDEVKQALESRVRT